MTNLAAKLSISLAHSDAEIDRTLEAVEDTLKGLRARA
jgi:glutamate-1-semialdehyde aminotransferase